MITSLGAGSGLDLEGLVSQLVAAEARPTAARLAQREGEYQASLSGLGLLSSSLANFLSAMSGLEDATSFDKRSTSLSTPDSFTATASSNAAVGDYQIEVTRLAEAHKLVSAGYADQDAIVGTGTLTIIAGETALAIEMDSSNNTLAGLRDAINQAAKGAGISATIINADDGLGGTESKLLLTSLNTGTDNQINIVVSDGDGNDIDASGLSAFAFEALGTQNMGVAQAVVDAQILLDGQTVTRSSNAISDAITGVTINLTKAEPGTKVTLGIKLDTGAASKLVADFVAGYNTLRETITDLSSFDQDSSTGGLLLGDATLRGVDRQLRRLVFSDNNLVAGLPNLSAIGVTTTTEGTLEINQDGLNAAIANHFDDFAAFFSGSDGLAGKLTAMAKDFTGATGAISGRTTSIESSLSRIEDQRDRLDRRLLSLDERLRAQFSALDLLVSSLNATGQFLDGQLRALPGFVRDKK